MRQRNLWTGVILLWILLSMSCGSPNTRWQNTDIGHTPDPAVKIHRYEKALFSVDSTRMASEITKMTDVYAVFLGNVPPDSAGILQLIRYIKDPLIQQLYRETMVLFPDVSVQERELSEAFRYYSHYFPDHAIPQVFTYISGIDYQNPVIFQPPAMLIALDMYLGKEYEPYKQLGLPSYLVNSFTREFMIRDCIRELAIYHMNDQYPGDNVMDKMIFEGKKLYFLDAVLPFQPDSVKIGYGGEQIKWCMENEANLWKFFIENEILYSTDIQIINKFFTDGPFTRGFPGSPARLGAWLGWQIVRKYMDAHPKLTLQDLLFEKDSRKILQESGYKPGKK